MAKDPAFLFYPNDYVGGTMGMTFEEKGAYMELLVLQFNKGAFTIEQAKKCLNGSFEKLWPELKEKFVEANGMYYNERLEQEKLRRKSFYEKQSVNGKKGGRKPKDNPTLNPNIGIGLTNNRNENENRNIDVNEDKGGMGEKEGEALIPTMLNIFCSKNSNYERDKDRDYPEMLKIISFLTKNKIPRKDDASFLQKWKSIVDFISSHSFYRNYSIKQINTHIQAILQAKENGNTTTTHQGGAVQKGDTRKLVNSNGGFGKL